MNELFQMTETKPTKLQAARRALADAMRERETCDIEDTPAIERAITRFADLVAEEEKVELKKIQNI